MQYNFTPYRFISVFTTSVIFMNNTLERPPLVSAGIIHKLCMPKKLFISFELSAMNKMGQIISAQMGTNCFSVFTLRFPDNLSMCIISISSGELQYVIFSKLA